MGNASQGLHPQFYGPPRISRREHPMKSKLIATFCTLYILAHVVVVAVPIRAWPFTDYPMFSPAYYADQPLFVYRYSVIMKDGSRHRLERSFARGYGIGEPNLTSLLLHDQMNEFEGVLRKWLAEQRDRDQIAAIVITRAEAIRPDAANPELQIEESDVLTVRREDLE